VGLSPSGDFIWATMRRFGAKSHFQVFVGLGTADPVRARRGGLMQLRPI
jgi:hypothetical protein